MSDNESSPMAANRQQHNSPGLIIHAYTARLSGKSAQKH